MVAGNHTSFIHELNGLTPLALDADEGNYNFREIFNPATGKPDGAYQAWGDERPNYRWESLHLQTWSASAYINMVHNGLAGIRFDDNGISSTPYLPDNVHHLELSDIKYRLAN